MGDRRTGSGEQGLGQADVGSDTHTHTHNLQATQLSLKSYPPLFLHSLGEEDSLEFSPGGRVLREPAAFPRQGSGRGWERACRPGRVQAAEAKLADCSLPGSRKGPGPLPLLEGQAPSAWGPRVTRTLGVIIRLPRQQRPAHPAASGPPGPCRRKSFGWGEANS